MAQTRNKFEFVEVTLKGAAEILLSCFAFLFKNVQKKKNTGIHQSLLIPTKREFLLRQFIIGAILGFLLPFPVRVIAQDFQSSLPEDITRVWVGPDYWANRLQDWRITDGRLECITANPNNPMRTVHLLTRSLGNMRGDLRTSVRTGAIDIKGTLSEETLTGFIIGAGGEKLDYRAAALVHHFTEYCGGVTIGLNGNGKIVFLDGTKTTNEGKSAVIPAKLIKERGFERKKDEDLELRLEVTPTGNTYRITFSVYDYSTHELLNQAEVEGIESSKLVGNIALVSNFGSQTNGACYWFRDWRVSGSKVEKHDNRRFGPVICALHTLSNNILKISVQLPPLSEKDTPTARLEIRHRDSEPWRAVATEKIIRPGCTVTFRVEKWDSKLDAQYRIVYELRETGGKLKEYTWEGKIRQEPLNKEIITVAGFTGNANCGFGLDRKSKDADKRWTHDNIWFPHTNIVNNVKAQNPDLLVFTGDQVYDDRSPVSVVRKQEKPAQLDYLYVWYLWCWAYRDLVREIPAVCLPDDHDVFHGNLWGWSGRKAPGGNLNNGGYIMSPEFVKMVERTQTSNMPDPYDPTPIEQGIGVYYCAMNYGGISFAILEDRKFKSPPTFVTDAEIDDGHIMTPDYNVKNADAPGAKLLGERQLRFLRNWAADWEGVYMKVALSQTLFCNLQTRNNRMDRDLDSNGWPQSGRNRALHELRRGFAFMLSGDQHLGSILHHGIDDWNDAGYSLCVPSVANFYVRFFQPPFPGKNRKPGMPDYTGEFLDGLGNHITVHAVANPLKWEELSEEQRVQNAILLHHKAPGFGLIRLNKNDRTITMECWPRNSDPNNPTTQYNDWPLTIKMEDNYGRKAAAYLPKLNFVGTTDPVVQVIDESDGEIVYTLRTKGTSFQPKVFREGLYTIHVGEPGTPQMQILKNIHSLKAGEDYILYVRF